MDEYHLAFRFWMALVAVVLVAPYAAAAAGRLLHVLSEHVSGKGGAISLPSSPRPSSPY